MELLPELSAYLIRNLFLNKSKKIEIVKAIVTAFFPTFNTNF